MKIREKAMADKESEEPNVEVESLPEDGGVEAELEEGKENGEESDSE